MADSVPPATPTRERPLGVTIIAVLAAISGVLGLIGSLAVIGVSGSAAVGLGVVIGALLLIVSVLLLVFAYGAWALRPWAWTLGVVLEGVGVVIGLYELVQGDIQGSFNIILAAIVLWYLFRPEVKAAFGRT